MTDKEQTLGERCVENNVCNGIPELETEIVYCENRFVKSKENCKYLNINKKGEHLCEYYKKNK